MMRSLMPTNPEKPIPTSLKLPPKLREQVMLAINLLGTLRATGLLPGSPPKDLTSYVIRALEQQIQRDTDLYVANGGVLPGTDKGPL